MKRPFSNAVTSNGNVRTSSQNSAGEIGGAAPGQLTIGTRRDFGFVPQFLPSLTIAGGLKQPPRG